MPTYKIKAPDGNTYSIQGPEGATDEQVREQVLKQHPTAGGAPAAPRPKLTTETPTYDPTEGMSFLEKALAGAGGRAVEMGRGLKQTLNIGDQAELQKEIDQAKARDTALKDTAGGMVGSAATDIASFALPGAAATNALKLGTLIPRLTNPALVKGAQLAAKFPKIASLTGAAGVSAGQSAVFDPLASDESLGEKTAFAAGGGALGKTGGELINRIISPFRGSTSTARQQAAKLLKDQGIELSAGQEIGSPLLRQIEMGLKQNPLTKALMTADSPEQRKAVSGMFAKEIGESGDATLTADVLNSAQKRLGGQFDALKGQTAKIGYDPEYTKDYADLLLRMGKKQNDMGVENPQVNRLLENALDRITSGRAISGDAYNELRSNLSDLAFNEKSGIVKDAAKALMRMEDKQAIRAFGDTAKDVASARATYGKTKRLTTPGVLDLEGNVNTTTLGNAVRQRDRDAYARGTLDSFGAKAKAAQEILKPMGPDSGTASNLLVAKMLANPSLLLGMGGAATYGAAQDPSSALGTAAGLGGALSLTQTKAGRKYLANALMAKNPELAKFIQRSGRTVGASFAADE